MKKSSLSQNRLLPFGLKTDTLSPTTVYVGSAISSRETSKLCIATAPGPPVYPEETNQMACHVPSTDHASAAATLPHCVRDLGC